MSIHKSARIFVAGHRGMVGAALVRKLQAQGYTNLLLRTHAELDLIDGRAVREFFAREKIDYVFLAAAKVGGIGANAAAQADFLYQNLMIAANVIESAAQYRVKKLINLGSACIYPKVCAQPIVEDALLSAPLEPTNEGYAIAKIAALKFCEMHAKQNGHCFISAMPANLYGPGDTFDLEKSHVIPAMLMKFHQAMISQVPSVQLWGTGKPTRDFLHVDDLADGLVRIFETVEQNVLLNVGSGQEVSIAELAQTIAEVTGFRGQVNFDTSKLDGTPRRVLDISKMKKLGWSPRISLHEGLKQAYAWALANDKLVTLRKAA